MGVEYSSIRTSSFVETRCAPIRNFRIHYATHDSSCILLIPTQSLCSVRRQDLSQSISIKALLLLVCNGGPSLKPKTKLFYEVHTAGRLPRHRAGCLPVLKKFARDRLLADHLKSAMWTAHMHTPNRCEGGVRKPDRRYLNLTTEGTDSA
ncbi:hypothetical protein K491DRAFT_431081 [Lophiostoma macrostomum CBS 122681]|uniref:Uncharacterized protein n=1 Tax=Lophiostoma macrostomum CBS 122681 TaxID=1314788 RepID=A0A6A6T945_9PLEO|nr:hypothetical protein K491DRAFT_431081 [Lophiostoma macrostomum CBS 122681]